MEHLDLNIEEIYQDLKDAAHAQGALTRGEWDDLVDEALESKRAAGELDEDEDWETIRESLRLRFDDFEDTISEM